MLERVEWPNSRAKNEFRNWLHSELFNALNDRGNLELQWKNWIEQYRAPRRGPIDFPYPGSSNEEMPLTAMHAEPVIAQMMQSLHAPRNMWSAIDLSGEFTDNVNAITEFMTVIDRRFLKMRGVNQRAFPDGIILGTMCYHPTWRFEQRKVRGYDDVGEIITNTRVIDQPIVRHIPISDFIFPANAWDLNPDAAVAPARWCGHRIKLTENQLHAMAKGQEPFLPNFDSEALALVLPRETQEEGTVEGKLRDLDQLKPSVDKKIELFRIECRYDVDGDGVDEDLIVIWHQPTASILQAVYQFWHHGHRLYEVEQYIKTFSLLGVGIAEMAEWAQAAISKLLNAQINNAILANTRMFGIPQGYDWQPGEPLYPGKVFPLGPGDQIQEVKLSDAYQTIFQIMAAVQEWQEERDSVNELRTGNISGLPSRTPATSVLTLMGEGNKKFDMILGNWRTGAIGNIGKRTLQMMAQRHQSGSRKWAQLAVDMLGTEDGRKVIDVLAMPQTTIEEGLGIEVATTSSQVNKEVEKQSLLGLNQIMAQNYAGLIQAAQMTGDQNLVVSTVLAAYNGGIEFIKRLLEAFDVQNPERYLPQQTGAAQGGAPQLGAGPALAPMPTAQQLQLLQSLAGLG